MEDITEYLPLSPDHNKERLEALKTMFPDLFTSEGQLNVDELKKVVDPKSVNETERYEFRWFGKSQAKRNAFTPSNATLVYDEKRSVNPDKAENLIIEGENLEVLKLLSSAYREKIKCIYIDPPYNTGKDFVYSDNFTQDKKGYWEDAGVIEQGIKIDTNTEADGRYHSNWLNMMYSRLLIARQLLREDGVVFISIDDNEVHHVRKLCDEVFGENNFISQIIIQSNKRGQTYKEIAKTHEYLIVYSKSESYELFELEKNSDDLPFEDEHGKYDLWELRNRNPKFGRFNRPNLYYPIYVCPTSVNEQNLALISSEKTEEFSLGVYPKNSEGVDSCWRWDVKKLKENILDPYKNLVAKKRQDGEWNIYQKSRKNTTKAKSLWDDNSVISEQGTVEMGKLGLKNLFDHPKPINLIKRVIQIGSDQNDIVLDFFSGSGATAQAVLDINNESDESNRKFILVQIPEATDDKSEAYRMGYKKISDITVERNKRVISNIIKDRETKTLDIFKDNNGNNGLGFKVFKLTKSKFPRVEWTPEPEKTETENIEALKKYILEKEAQLVTLFNRDELTTEILLKKGFNLNYTTVKQSQFEANEVYLATDGNKQALICLDAPLMDATVEYLKTHTDKIFICLERALDTTKKWNLKHYLGDKLQAF